MRTPVANGPTKRFAALALLAAVGLLGNVSAQEADKPAVEPRPLPVENKPIIATEIKPKVYVAPLTTITADYVGNSNGGLIQAQCANCSSPPPRELSPLSNDGCGGTCVPGGHCQRCESETGFGRLYCHLYNAFQCADPCYEPRWVAGANAALFVEPARPQTMLRLRWDSGRNMTQPDRSEVYWAQIGTKGPGRPETSVDNNELFLYSEAATGRFSFFTELSFRGWEGQVNGSGSGFGDMRIGTKTLMIDTEYVQLTLMFRTFLPTGSAGKGAGTGHVSLEPALIMAAKLHPDTYFQGQIGQWIPISGSPGAAGGVLRYSAAINHIMARAFVDSQFIATLEFTGECFEGGSYTAPPAEQTGGALIRRQSSGGNYFGFGPGFRWVMSDRCDFGVGVNFAVSRESFAAQFYRTEFRLKF